MKQIWFLLNIFTQRHCKFQTWLKARIFIIRKIIYLHIYFDFILQAHALSSPSLSCDNCFKKLMFLQSLLGKIFTKKEHKNSFNVRMHQYKVSLGKKEEKDSSIKMEPISQTKREVSKEEIPKTDPKVLLPIPVSRIENDQQICSNNYTCNCESCQSKFGGLPILLQGIERKTMEERLEAQPSTSSGTTADPVESKFPKKYLSCHYCNKTFHHKGDYNKHLRKHTKEKPFSCTVCHRKFSHTSNLQRHFRLHSGQKPFTCKNCSKSFSRKDKLDSHKKSRLCQKSSTQSSSSWKIGNENFVHTCLFIYL